MTKLLYLDDPCLRSFSAKVVEVDGDWIMLDQTAFYPGGGGQEADSGWIDGIEVTEVRKEEGIGHLLPEHDLSVGDEVVGTLDWARRLDLMRAHTAEHMLFSALSILVEGVELVKISIGQERKSLIVKGQIDWGVVSRAQREVNQAVTDGMEVKCTWLKRGDPALDGIRVKLDRIQGDDVRVVKIGKYDTAACSGVHVPNTGHIGSIIVTRLTSAKPAGSVEIEFEIGRKAVDRALELANLALIASESMGSHPQDLPRAISNLKDEMDSCRTSLKRYGRQVLDTLQAKRIGGARVYSGVYHGLDRRTLVAAAGRFVEEEGTICVLVGLDETMMVLVARSDDLGIDCVQVLNKALEPIGGRGGGKPEFATGGAPTSSGGDEVVERALDLISRSFGSASQ